MKLCHLIIKARKLSVGERFLLGFELTNLPVMAVYCGPQLICDGAIKGYLYKVISYNEQDIKSLPIGFSTQESKELASVKEQTKISTIRPNLWFNVHHWMHLLPNKRERFYNDGLNIFTISHVISCELLLQESRN